MSLSGVDGVAVVLTSKTMRRNVGRRSVVAPEALTSGDRLVKERDVSQNSLARRERALVLL